MKNGLSVLFFHVIDIFFSRVFKLTAIQLSIGDTWRWSSSGRAEHLAVARDDFCE